jgi:membrane protease subunit (stomatin/prohibitin family)
VHEGQLADVFAPGLYMLETNNMPVLTTLQHWDHGFKSPFVSEIYFVNTRRFTDLKWGTRNPITCRDPEFGMVRLRAYGTYTMRVTDPARFMTEIVGTDGEFTTSEIEFQIRNHIVTNFSQIIASSGIPVLDMAANTIDLGKIVAERIAPKIAEYGLELPAFYVENVSLPENVEKALDARTKMGIVGDLAAYQQISAAEAMTAAANNPGGDGGMGAGLGMGMGMAMANQMAKGMSPPQPPAHPAAAPPPPPPVEKVWHTAAGGETRGPFSRADLGQMARDGGSPATPMSGPPARTAGGAPRRSPSSPSSSPSSRRRLRPPDNARLTMPWGRAKAPPPPPPAPHPPAPRPAEGGLETHRFPCDACGADLRFRPGTTEMVCIHCGNTEARSPTCAAPSRRSTCAPPPPCRRRRWRPSAPPAAAAAAPRSSSTPTFTPRNARSAPRPSSPTPASTARSSPRPSSPSSSPRRRPAPR